MRRILTIVLLLAATQLFAQEVKLESSLLSGLKLRSIGPALTSGRVVDVAVVPSKPWVWYVAAAAGGVWKTNNNGVTFTPVFDSEGSYSIGCISIDPNNENVIWVGSGENNNQRSVAYGDGVYKSEDGGKTWKNMGLKSSEHIGMISIDPRNSEVVYVAAYGPLWSEGGERGLYKSTDGGKTWNNILHVSDYTGVNEVHLNPKNPDIIYATAHQRMRHVFTYIGGGPESAIYRSTDGGKTFDILKNGLPSGVDVGRIGLDISPVNPDVVYAIVEAQYNKGGIFKSLDRGASWSKMNDFNTSGNYYQKIICDPKEVNKLYIMDTYARYSKDGGKTIERITINNKHVDDHCIWVDPSNTNHWIMGCDGGLYETWDQSNNWLFKANLPITQFYKVAVDNDQPFYNVYGGTQDNFSLGGPARTLSDNGILNADWFVTNGGDGFESQIDPSNPDIVYAQAQYGYLVRYDRKSGESLFIQPQPGENEAAYRWNWDAPLLISPHNPQRLYFAANKIFKSNDRGNSWETISPDLTAQIDRNELKVMGKVWSVDAVMKNKSTTIYGNIVALDESPVKAGLLYAGTDDGLIQITENDGKTWTKVEGIKGVPENTYVNMLVASPTNENVVYAVFNNHKRGDFKPYIYLSENKGKTWTNISGNLPERGSVYAIAQDHVNENLLFAGTEFGLFFSADRGINWVQLKAGLPTIAIRDIAIQRRENDLVLASFGRGFYVLDNYSPLRTVKSNLDAKAAIFPIKDALMYVASNDLGRGRKGFQGDALYSADNPEFGACISYYLKDDIKTQKEKRREAEKKTIDDTYPTLEDLEKEKLEEDPFLIFTITDVNGHFVRRLTAPAKKGLNRIYWDFKYSNTRPVTVNKDNSGMWALPGTYNVAMAKSVNGVVTDLGVKATFKCVPLNNNTLAATDKASVEEFALKVAELSRVVDGANSYRAEMASRLALVKTAMQNSGANSSTLALIKTIEDRLFQVNKSLNGDEIRAGNEFETLPGIGERVNMVVWSLYSTTSAPTQTFINNYKIAYNLSKPILTELQAITVEIEKLESLLDDMQAPYTPGRLPVLKE
ncbi:glycosyl hydrolase [bacterium]|nr:glycosyl hydrolase [bacterium]